MFCLDLKRKISFILLFCVVFLNVPCLDVLAYGYKEAGGSVDEPMTGLSVGDILESNKTYVIKNSFQFSKNEIYHAKEEYGIYDSYGKLTNSDAPRNILNEYDPSVEGYDSNSTMLEAADELILEYNPSSNIRNYDFLHIQQVPPYWGKYSGHSKYPYYYNDSNKKEERVQNDNGTFTFTLNTTLEDMDYIITAMIPEISGTQDGIISYNYRIVLEPVPAGTIFHERMQIGDKFKGKKTYAFLLIQNETNNLFSLDGYDLHKVYGIGPGEGRAPYQNFGADVISFTLDTRQTLTYKDVPLYSNDVFNSLSGGAELYGKFKSTEFVNEKQNIPEGLSVIPIMVYITFPEEGTYTFQGGTNTSLNKSESSDSTYNLYSFTYSFQFESHVCVEGDPVDEVVVPATCTTDGFNEEVVYCKECKEEMRRTFSHTTPALGHIFAESELTYCHIADINDSSTYSALTSLNPLVVDKQTLIENAYNKDAIKDSVTEDKIVSYALCVRAQDSYVLKAKNPPATPVINIEVGDHHWNSITENVNFNIFFKTAKDVTLSAEAFDADVVDVAYYISDKKEDIAPVTGWSVIPYEDDSDLPVYQINSYGKYVIYAKVTDTNGKVGYASSAGIVFDNIAPEFLGVKDGDSIVEDSLVFEVYDEYLMTVSIDGVDMSLSDNYTLTNDKATHTVRAVDKAGNESIISFTFKTQNSNSTPPNGSNQPSDLPPVPTVANIIPQTGLAKWPVWALSLLGLTCMVVSISVYKKGKKHDM